MHISLLFWLALLLPGYVLIRRYSEDDLDSGLLGTLGLSYLAVFAVLSPVSIACYLLKLPVWVLSAACVLLILAAPIELSRRRWWPGFFKLFVTGVCIELLILIVDMAMGTRVGSVFAGDAFVHMGRIRFLVDHGMSNLDPYCATPYFYPIYHTNILHAMYAVATELTGGDHLRVWSASLPWGKLLCASGAYYLVWCLFRRQWPAWVAAIYIMILVAPVTFTVYPNQIAQRWVAPYMIGFAVQACCNARSRRSVWKLAAAALVLGQIHGLYAFYTAGVIAPALGILFLVRFLRRRPDRWHTGACLAVTCLAFVFPLVSKLMTAPSAPTTTQKTQAQARASPPPIPPGYIGFENGWMMRDPRLGLGPKGKWTAALMGVGIGLAMLGRRRREAAYALSFFGVALAALYLPPLCTALFHVVQKAWILGRFGFIISLFFVTFGIGAAAFALEAKTRFWWVRSLLSIAVCAWVIPFPKKEPYDWESYLGNAIRRDEHLTDRLKGRDRLRSVLGRYIPSGQTVLVSSKRTIDLVMLHDAYVVASPSTSAGVNDLQQRRLDRQRMLSQDTPWQVRRELLHKYHIEYWVGLGARRPPEWARGHTSRVIKQPPQKGGQLVIARLNLE